MRGRRPIYPSAYLVAALVVMLGLHLWLPVEYVISPPYSYLGGLFVVLGVVFNVWVSNAFHRAQTTIKPFEEPSQLLERGLFRLSRNPVYLGMVLFLVGVAGLLGSLSPVVVIPVFAWVVDRRLIVAEEVALEERFGDAYRDYRGRVRRWL